MLMITAGFKEENKVAKIQSVEPNVADLANGWLKSYGLDYKLEQESLNIQKTEGMAEIVQMQSCF